MKITIYRDFKKKSNSTKIPTVAGEEKEVLLKEGTSLENPTFIFSENAFDVDYCKAFGHFYFMEDIRSVGDGRSEVSFSLDPLGTYRDDILNYRAFVERSSSNFDTLINDSYLSQKQSYASEETFYSDETLPLGTCYAVRVANNDIDNPTGISTYIMSEEELSQVMHLMYDSDFFGGVIGSEIAKVLLHPTSYILSLKRFPLDKSAFFGFDANFSFGWWNTDIQTIASSVEGYRKNFTIQKPARFFNDWRDFHSDFTKFTYTIPGVGVIELNPLDVYRGLECIYTVDLNTGDCQAVIQYEDTKGIVTRLSGKAGFDILLSNTTTLNNIIEGITEIGASSKIGNVPGILDGIRALTNSNVSTIGGNGGSFSFDNFILFNLSRKIFGSAEYATTVAGRPLMKNVQLSTLSGFCKCGAASIEIAGSHADCEKINSMLNSGFYIE